MGFGFNIFGFPILIISTIVLLFLYWVKRYRKALLILAAMWIFMAALILITEWRSQAHRPISLSRKDIIGDYRIDRYIYPGTNADWQYDHYRFTITSSDSLYFYITDHDTIRQTLKYKIVYGNEPYWTIQGPVNYHVIRFSPALYRGHDHFMYVFHSRYYGNMFFQKQSK